MVFKFNANGDDDPRGQVPDMMGGQASALHDGRLNLPLLDQQRRGGRQQQQKTQD